jgi:ectoine hydroxylase-related dioxygenase (phytanoyl-CoA dioxygenase family)
MVSTRIHLDACDEDNGPLRVIGGSHRFGRLSEAAVDGHTVAPPTVCTADLGDVLLMKPLLLHASSKARTPSRRRVLHLEWACEALPAPLSWRWQ